MGIVQSFAAPAADEIRLEKEYEQQLKREENLKKSRPEIYDNLKRSANEARLKAYQKVIESRGGQAQTINAINPPECKYYSTEMVCLKSSRFLNGLFKIKPIFEFF